VRWVALASLPILFGTVVVHFGNGWGFTSPKGGWEYPAYLVSLHTPHLTIQSELGPDLGAI
jgi:putative oxidoreductase